MTILVIEDSRFMQLAIEKALRDAGHRAIIAPDGEAGLNAAIQQSPDFILLDIMLPSLPGTSVLRSLKLNPVTSTIPVIVLTGLTRVDQARLKDEGADGYLAKSQLDLEGGGGALLRAMQDVVSKTAQTSPKRS
ncbi:MAG: response regulator [Terriglobales bacterium]